MEGDPWFGVELRHLLALTAVAREGSFSGAADSLGYVQSVISHKVASLEQIVGVRLVERCRGSKEVRLTPEGALLAEHAERIQAHMHAAQADLRARTRADASAPVRVGISRDAASGLLPQVTARLGRTSPDVHLEPVEAATDAALRTLVEQSRVDVAIGDLPTDSWFASHTLVVDSCVLVVPADSRWAQRAPTAEELGRLPLIELAGWHYLSTLDAWFASHGIAARMSLSAESEATVCGFVAAGLGFGLLPRLGREAHDPRVALVDLAGVLPTRRVGVFWNAARQEAHPRAQQIVDAVVSVAGEPRQWQATRLAAA